MYIVTVLKLYLPFLHPFMKSHKTSSHEHVWRHLLPYKGNGHDLLQFNPKKPFAHSTHCSSLKSHLVSGQQPIWYLGQRPFWSVPTHSIATIDKNTNQSVKIRSNILAQRCMYWRCASSDIWTRPLGCRWII